jgi:hypothetical protein
MTVKELLNDVPRQRSRWLDMKPKGRRLSARLALIAAVLAAALGALACGKGKSEAAGCPTVETNAPAIDERVMAFLSAARAAHHEADIKEHAGDVDGAIALMERLVSMMAPAASETDEVMADAYARLAELRLEKGDVEGADRDVESGLDHVSGATYFRGHLLELGGIVEERRAAALADAGSGREAEEARTRALSLLEEAVRVQEQVITRALDDGGEK